MGEKSYVTLIANLCLVCGKQFDTGELALDRWLRERFDMHTVMGLGLCPEHEAKYKEGYIALVACDPEKSRLEPNGTIKPENAHRTGYIAHLRAEVWPKLFNTPLPMGESGLMLPAVFVEQELIEQLQKVPGAEQVDG